MTLTSELRQQLRESFRRKRLSLSTEQQKQFAADITEQAHSLVFQADTKKVGLYLSFDGELDTGELIQSCWQKDIEIYLPVLHPFSPGHLLFQEYTKDTQMIRNKYGIEEPKLDVTKTLPCDQLDVLFTPLVAFDEQGNRLGMGGGFYDRTLSALLQNERVKTCVVGLAHNIQLSKDLPIEAWDMSLPAVLTPSRLYRF
jgi:5-formyltetrahydrofolate cyclo-ligase